MVFSFCPFSVTGNKSESKVLVVKWPAGFTFCLVYFWKIPAGHEWLDALALFGVGFLVYGPQMLVGVAAADVASKKAAATATGLTGTFGYLGATVCGVGTGLIVDKWGWDGGFYFYIGSAIIAMVLFFLTVSARSEALETAEEA